MIIQAHIRRAIRLWSAWQRTRRMSRVVPEYAAAVADLRARRQRHKQTRPALARLRGIVTAELRREVRG